MLSISFRKDLIACQACSGMASNQEGMSFLIYGQFIIAATRTICSYFSYVKGFEGKPMQKSRGAVYADCIMLTRVPNEGNGNMEGVTVIELFLLVSRKHSEATSIFVTESGAVDVRPSFWMVKGL